MHKPLFLFFISALLCSCSAKTDSNSLLEADKKDFLVSKEEIKTDVSSYFASSFSVSKGVEGFFVRYQISNAAQDYHSVRILLSAEDEFYYFGYDKDNYTLVKEKAEKDESKHKYFGIAINFVSEVMVQKMKVSFHSDEVSFLYQL